MRGARDRADDVGLLPAARKKEGGAGGVGVDDPTGAAPVASKRIYKINIDGATDVGP